MNTDSRRGMPVLPDRIRRTVWFGPNTSFQSRFMEGLAPALAELIGSASFEPGDRVQTLRGSLHGVVKRVLEDGRVVWLPDKQSAELTALPETLVKEY